MIETILAVLLCVSLLILMGSFLLTLVWEIIVAFVEKSWPELLVNGAIIGAIVSLVGIALLHFFGH